MVVGTFWTQNMTVTGSLTDIQETDDGKTLYTEVTGSTAFKSPTVSLVRSVCFRNTFNVMFISLTLRC